MDEFTSIVWLQYPNLVVIVICVKIRWFLIILSMLKIKLYDKRLEKEHKNYLAPFMPQH